MPDRSFQQLFKRNHCYGCGPHNSHGLQLQSHWIDEATAACYFTPEAHHCAAPKHVVNGGIIATVVDCHAVCTAIANAYSREGRMIGEGEEITYVTGSLKVDYIAPSPIDQIIQVNARATSVLGKKTIIACEIWSGETLSGRAQVVCVRVPNDWHQQH